MDNIKHFFDKKSIVLYVIASLLLLILIILVSLSNLNQVHSLSDILSQIWNYNIYNANNAKVTLGKITIAILLIVFGIYFARSLSNKIISKLLKKTHLDIGAQAAMGKIGYYILIILFTLLALTIAEVPLTALTIFGGALAIGIGFGSQNLVNNFISGLIIQIERPVNAGDFVEIEGTSGQIKEIGARSTKILSSNNTMVIIPNGYFLDKKFVNWTLDSNIVRGQINVGFSNTIESNIVFNLIKNCLLEIKEIKGQKESIVIMSDLLESSTIYTIFVWFEVETNMDKIIIESKIRKMIFDDAIKNNYLISLPKDKKDIQVP